MLVLALALACMIGWLLAVGRPLLVPLVTAIIAVYILRASAAALARLPGVGRLPDLVLRLIVLAAFALGAVALGLVVSVTVRQMVGLAPSYQENLQRLVATLATAIGAERDPTWADIRSATIDRLDLRALATQAVGSLTSLGGAIVAVVIYAAFLSAEAAGFSRKLALVFPRRDEARLAGEVLSRINARIGDYLAIKTAINILLGGMSWAILWMLDVDFALFWAVVIGLLNYIPYVGSLLGVMFPVALSLAQFGSPGMTLLLAVLLTGAQVLVGAVIEPRVIGRQVNLSPVVVLIALSFWTALWGVAGAILAVPLTSILMILLTAFPETRFLAVLLAADPAAQDLSPPPGRG